MSKRYSEYEKDYIRENIYKITARLMGEHIGRSAASVRNAALRFGLLDPDRKTESFVTLIRMSRSYAPIKRGPLASNWKGGLTRDPDYSKNYARRRRAMEREKRIKETGVVPTRGRKKRSLVNE